MALRIHAICLALNEECFISEQLKTLYPFCSGISILTQYDRDWYGKEVLPDKTAEIVLNYPDPDGKISLCIRRWKDEAAARNHEMLAIMAQPHKRIKPHGSPIEDIHRFHQTPDYFLILDADEFYDPETFPRIVECLERRRPRGMRVTGYNYFRTWNHRVPLDSVHFCHFGFLKPGVLFEQQRIVSWNEFRLQKAFRMLRLPFDSGRLFGFVECPPEIGFFHHGCWLGDDERLWSKITRSSHADHATQEYRDSLEAIPTTFVPTSELPTNIRDGAWPKHFFARASGGRNG